MGKALPVFLLAVVVGVILAIDNSAQQLSKVQTELKAGKLFSAFDADRNGVLDEKEFTSGWVQHSEDECPKTDYSSYVFQIGDWCTRNEYCSNAVKGMYEVANSLSSSMS